MMLLPRLAALRRWLEPVLDHGFLPLIRCILKKVLLGLGNRCVELHEIVDLVENQIVFEGRQNELARQPLDVTKIPSFM